MDISIGFSMGRGQWPANGSPGGGDPPAWVPAGAIAHVDFVNDPPRAWVIDTEYNGDLTEIFGTDTMSAGYTYNPAEIDPGVGYGNGTDQSRAAAFGPLIDAFMFEFSVVLEYKAAAIQSSVEWTEPTFATDLFMKHTVGTNWTLTDLGLETADEVLSAPTTGTAGVTVKTGLTVKATEMFGAAAGQAMENQSNPGTFTTDPATSVNPDNILLIFTCLKRLTVYNPVKTLAELQALTA